MFGWEPDNDIANQIWLTLYFIKEYSLLFFNSSLSSKSFENRRPPASYTSQLPVTKCVLNLVELKRLFIRPYPPPLSFLRQGPFFIFHCLWCLQINWFAEIPPELLLCTQNSNAPKKGLCKEQRPSLGFKKRNFFLVAFSWCHTHMHGQDAAGNELSVLPDGKVPRLDPH